MKHLLILLAMAMAPVAMNAQDNSKQVQPEKATTKACCSKIKKKVLLVTKMVKMMKKFVTKIAKKLRLAAKTAKETRLAARRQKRWYGF